MKAYPTVLMCILCLVFLTFCGGGKENAAEGEHTHEQEGETPSQKAEDEHEHQHLTVPADKQKAWGIRVGHVHKESLTARVVLPGILALNENRTAHVSAFVHGQIADLSVQARQGVAL